MTTISLKIPKKLKEKIHRFGIPPSDLKNAIAEEVRRRALRNLKGKAEKLKKALEKMHDLEIIEGIREERGLR